jgi:hypothetical protein
MNVVIITRVIYTFLTAPYSPHPHPSLFNVSLTKTSTQILNVQRSSEWNRRLLIILKMHSGLLQTWFASSPLFCLLFLRYFFIPLAPLNFFPQSSYLYIAAFKKTQICHFLYTIFFPQKCLFKFSLFNPCIILVRFCFFVQQFVVILISLVFCSCWN